MPHRYQVTASHRVHEGRVVALRRDQVTMPGGSSAWRDVVEHPGSVAVVALDAQDAVVVVRQYRHPVGRALDELPAGILDVPGEPALRTAQRELAEEAGLAAGRWDVLVDLLTSPGMTSEASRIFLARDLREVDRDVQEHEESELTCCRVPLADLVAGVLSGRYENALLVAGVLAAESAARVGFAGLRAAHAPWRARPAASASRR